MKKTLLYLPLLLAALMLGLLPAACSDGDTEEEPIVPTELPAEAKTLLDTYFTGYEIVQTIRNNDTPVTYEVWFRGGGKVKFTGLPPGQESQLRPLALLGISGLEQFVQCQTAQRLQKGQLAVQRTLQNGGELSGSRLPHADGLRFQNGVGKIIAQIGGVGEQGGFKGGHSIAQGGDGGGPGGHPVR